MIDPSLTVDARTAEQAMRLLSAVSRRRLPEIFRDESRLVIRNVIGLTPPSTGKADLGAKQRGERAIARDLGRLFIPVRLKGKRREEHPDVEAIHDRAFRGRPGRRRVRPERGRPYHVDRQKLTALARKLRGHVGKLAAGWLPAYRALGNPRVPAWIARHGIGGGRVQAKLEGPNMFVRAVNQAAGTGPDLQNRVQRAVDAQTVNIAAKVERAIAAKLPR